MTGFRTGNPKFQRKFLECRNCGQMRFIKARNLCETCHKYLTRDGKIEHFPPLQPHRSEAHQIIVPYRCGCFEPIPRAGECLKCGKPLRP